MAVIDIPSHFAIHLSFSYHQAFYTTIQSMSQSYTFHKNKGCFLQGHSADKAYDKVIRRYSKLRTHIPKRQ